MNKKEKAQSKTLLEDLGLELYEGFHILNPLGERLEDGPYVFMETCLMDSFDGEDSFFHQKALHSILEKLSSKELKVEKIQSPSAKTDSTQIDVVYYHIRHNIQIFVFENKKPIWYTSMAKQFFSEYQYRNNRKEVSLEVKEYVKSLGFELNSITRISNNNKALRLEEQFLNKIKKGEIMGTTVTEFS